jgi:hypothetical protein
MVLNFFARLMFQTRHRCLVLNIQKKPILPRDRRPLALRIFRVVIRPDIFSDYLERVNILHFGTQAWLQAVTDKMRLSYPMVSYTNLEVDNRRDKAYYIEDLEAELSNCTY